jgi:hypothetical protein
MTWTGLAPVSFWSSRSPGAWPGWRRLVGHEKRGQRRHHHCHRDVGNAYRQQCGKPERADQRRFRKREREQRERRIHRRQQARRRHVEHRLARRRKPVDAGHDVAADREDEMHAVGKSRHQDQRRDHVDEQIEPEIEAAEDAQRPQDRHRRTDHRQQRQRHATEKQIGDDRAEQEA